MQFRSWANALDLGVVTGIAS